MLFACFLCSKGRDDLGRGDERADSLQVCPLGDDLLKLLDCIGRKPAADCEHVLFQVRNHFYVGYDTVLRSLQGTDIANLPFLERIVPSFGALDAATPAMPPPAFVTDATRYDLSCVVRRDAPHYVRDSLRAVQPNDFRVVCAILNELAEFLILDDSQIEAFALALTQEVALIQGNFICLFIYFLYCCCICLSFCLIFLLSFKSVKARRELV